MDHPVNQDQQQEDDGIDPQMYAMFQKMMNKMMSEQAGTSVEKNPFREKFHGHKNKKASKKQVQLEEISDESESTEDTEEEYEVPPAFQKRGREQRKSRKSKNQVTEEPLQSQFREMARVVKDLQARDKGKKVFTSEDFYDGLEGDDDLENLPRKFIKFDGSGDPKAHLATFFAECSRFKRDNRALFLCFPRSLEGVAAKWYAEHINPIELKEFDKVVNLFIERFLFNTEALLTLSHLCNLRQNENEKARDFIHRWRSACNKMRDPISERHALSLILNNFSQPLRGLISTAPSRTFIELTERAEWLELSVENGVYEGFTFSKSNPKVSRRRKLTSPSLPTTTTIIAEISIKGRRKIIATAQAVQTTKIRKESLPLTIASLLSRIKGRNCVKKLNMKDGVMTESLLLSINHSKMCSSICCRRKWSSCLDWLIPLCLWGNGKINSASSTGQWDTTLRTVSFSRTLCKILLTRILLVEGEEEEKMDILKQPFPSHTTAVVSEHPFLPHEHIKPCSTQDLQVQHQVSVLRQAAPASKKMDLISAFGKMKVSEAPVQVSPQVKGNS